MRILVTGGAGFIGSAFLRHWYKQHPADEIINLDLFTYAANRHAIAELNDHPNYKLVVGDICDAELVDSIVKDVDVIVHFAAETHVDRSITDPAIFLKTNVLGTQVLLQAAIKHKIQRFHHISTDEVFGSLELGTENKFSETTPYDPRSPYSASKASSDHLVRAYGETYGLSYTITNCSNNYGAFQHPEKFFGLSITNLLLGKPIQIYGEGNQVRDWLYVDDHVKAIELVLTEGKAGNTYCVGGLTHDVTNLEVANMIVSLVKPEFESIQFIKDRAGHDVRYAVDWTKLHSDLGWEPSVSLEQGLEATVEWYQSNREIWMEMRSQEFESYYQKQYVER